MSHIDLLLDNNVSNCIWSGIVRSGIVGVELSGVELWEWNCPVILLHTSCVYCTDRLHPSTAWCNCTSYRPTLVTSAIDTASAKSSGMYVLRLSPIFLVILLHFAAYHTIYILLSYLEAIYKFLFLLCEGTLSRPVTGPWSTRLVARKASQ